MRDRLEIIHNLLSEDGSLWITIDDNEAQEMESLEIKLLETLNISDPYNIH